MFLTLRPVGGSDLSGPRTVCDVPAGCDAAYRLLLEPFAVLVVPMTLAPLFVSAWLAGFFAASRFDLNLRPVLNDCMKGLPMNTNGQGQKTAKIKLEKKEPGCSRDLTRY